MNFLGGKFTVENIRSHTEFMRIKNIVDLPVGKGLPNTAKITASACVYGTATGLWTLGMVRPENTKHALRRLAFISSSSALLGAAFAATTSIAAAYRGKDTPLNYGIGGISTGAILGVLSKSTPVGFGFAVLLGTSAAFSKLWVIEGWPHPFPKPEY